MSLQAKPTSARSALWRALGLPDGASLQDAGAQLAARLVSTEQALSSSLNLLRAYTTRSSGNGYPAVPAGPRCG